MASLLQKCRRLGLKKQHGRGCRATRGDEMSCFLTDTLSLPCDPHWQGGLCHAPGCNGTNAARDTAYCAFLPVHWTLAVQLCKTGSIDETYTTESSQHRNATNTSLQTVHTSAKGCRGSNIYELLRLERPPTFSVKNVWLILTNIYSCILYKHVVHVRKYLPDDCWCRRISEEWLAPESSPWCSPIPYSSTGLFLGLLWTQQFFVFF